MAVTSELLARLTSIDAVDDRHGRQLRLLRLLCVAELPFVFLIAVAPSVGLGALVGVPFFLAVVWWLMWKAAETQQERATALATELTNAELARTREQVEQRQAASSLLTNLARRNQSLLNRQLAKIDQLEAQEQDSEALAQLFTLDHLATRMRRNAESLLVLSGEEPPRRWGQPVPLADIARGAIAEIEDYTRVDVAPGLDVMVAGRAVGDLVHLVAELLENAATFSPPTTRVLLAGASTPDGGFIATITDAGIGMSDDELVAANRTLAEAPQVGLQLSGMLGFHVVARLAARYGVRVWLTRGVASGLVAMISLPADILGSEAAPAPAPGQQLTAVSYPAPSPYAPPPMTVPVAPVPLTPAAAASLTGGSTDVATPPVVAPLPVPPAVPAGVPPYPMPVAPAEPAPVAYAEPAYDPLTASVPPAADLSAAPLGDELAHATLAPVPDLPVPSYVFHESSMYEQRAVVDESADRPDTVETADGAAGGAAGDATDGAPDTAADTAADVPAEDEPYRFPVADSVVTDAVPYRLPTIELPTLEDAPAVIAPPSLADERSQDEHLDEPHVGEHVDESHVGESDVDEPQPDVPVLEPIVDVPGPAPVAATAVVDDVPAVERAEDEPLVEPVVDVPGLAPVAEVPAQAPPPEISATTPGGLARRVPRASLSPHLAQQPVDELVPEHGDEAAERTGSMLAAFQSGLAAGRLGGDAGTPAGGE